MRTSQSQAKSDLSITGTEGAQIAARIRQLRGAASQQEFARRVGITREHVSRLEAGTQPGTDVLRRLAEATGVSVDFLLGVGPARREAAPAADEVTWQEALEPLLAGTALRWPASAAARRRIDRAWRALPAASRADVRAFVARAALVAVALEDLLPARTARPVLDALSEALAARVVDRITAAGGGRRSARGRPIP
jgi:transcriptional regulator with XRE-family HTH domain